MNKFVMRLLIATTVVIKSVYSLAQDMIIIDEIDTSFGHIKLLPHANDGSLVELLFIQEGQKTQVFSHVSHSDLRFDTIPSLVNKPATHSFVIKNQGCCGNVHWESEITISYRDNALIVSGYTYSNGELNPSQDPNADALVWKTCDVNLITGEYALTQAEETRRGRTAPEAIPLANNLVDFFPKICRPFMGG